MKHSVRMFFAGYVKIVCIPNPFYAHKLVDFYTGTAVDFLALIRSQNDIIAPAIRSKDALCCS